MTSKIAIAVSTDLNYIRYTQDLINIIRDNPNLPLRFNINRSIIPKNGPQRPAFRPYGGRGA